MKNDSMYVNNNNKREQQSNCSLCQVKMVKGNYTPNIRNTKKGRVTYNQPLCHKCLNFKNTFYKLNSNPNRDQKQEQLYQALIKLYTEYENKGIHVGISYKRTEDCLDSVYNELAKLSNTKYIYKKSGEILAESGFDVDSAGNEIKVYRNIPTIPDDIVLFEDLKFWLDYDFVSNPAEFDTSYMIDTYNALVSKYEFIQDGAPYPNYEAMEYDHFKVQVWLHVKQKFIDLVLE